MLDAMNLHPNESKEHFSRAMYSVQAGLRLVPALRPMARCVLRVQFSPVSCVSRTVCMTSVLDSVLTIVPTSCRTQSKLNIRILFVEDTSSTCACTWRRVSRARVPILLLRHQSYCTQHWTIIYKGETQKACWSGLQSNPYIWCYFKVIGFGESSQTHQNTRRNSKPKLPLHIHCSLFQEFDTNTRLFWTLCSAY